MHQGPQTAFACVEENAMTNELIRLTAREAIRRVTAGEITPLDLIDAAERRIAECEPALNALPTLCFDRARDRAKRLMRRQDAA